MPVSEEIKRGTMRTFGWSVNWKERGSVLLRRQERHTKRAI